MFNFRSFLPAIVWLITSTVLLSMPGNDLPHSKLFDIPFFDKWVHLIMFFLLTASFSFPFIKSLLPVSLIYKRILLITILVIIYGVAMEFVQKYFVFQRSFDVVDIGFDSLGSIGGYGVMRKLAQKNRPR